MHGYNIIEVAQLAWVFFVTADLSLVGPIREM